MRIGSSATTEYLALVPNRNDDRELFGERLRRLRTEAGLSMLELANLAKVRESDISRWERNPEMDVRLSSLRKLAEALGVSIDYMAGGGFQAVGVLGLLDKVAEAVRGVPESDFAAFVERAVEARDREHVAPTLSDEEFRLLMTGLRRTDDVDVRSGKPTEPEGPGGSADDFGLTRADELPGASAPAPQDPDDVLRDMTTADAEQAALRRPPGRSRRRAQRDA